MELQLLSVIGTRKPVFSHPMDMDPDRRELAALPDSADSSRPGNYTSPRNWPITNTMLQSLAIQWILHSYCWLVDPAWRGKFRKRNWIYTTEAMVRSGKFQRFSWRRIAPFYYSLGKSKFMFVLYINIHVFISHWSNSLGQIWNKEE